MSNEKKEIYAWWNRPAKDIINPDGKELVNGGMGETTKNLNKILKEIREGK